MKKYKMFLLSLIILIFSIGIVSAEGITDFNAPTDFERNPVTFTYGDFEMDLKWYSPFMDYDNYFENTSDRKVNIINDTYAEYTDSFKDKVGALEIIDIGDDDKYIVESSYDDEDKTKLESCLKYLEEFNDVNKFKPLKIS